MGKFKKVIHGILRHARNKLKFFDDRSRVERVCDGLKFVLKINFNFVWQFPRKASNFNDDQFEFNANFYVS